MGFIADVFDAVMIDNTTGAVAGSTTLSSANINFEVQENEVRAGKGNALQGVLHSARDINVELEDVNYKYDWLARKVGQNITTGAGVGYAMPKWYTAVTTTGVTIALDVAPTTNVLATNGLKVYKADGTEITSGITVSSTTVTFATGVTAGDRVEVRTYKYNTSASTQTINFDSTSFASGVTLVLETIEIDENEVPKFKIQYIFDTALPNGSFAVSTSSERNASAASTSLRIAKPATSNIIGRVLRIPIP